MIIHIDYIFLTLKKMGLRVVVGNKKGFDSIVYTCALDTATNEDSFYSYTAYFDALTEQEGLELQQLVETKQTRKAHNFLCKRIKTDKQLGPCGPVRLSDEIPDDWFDGCKWAIDRIDYPKYLGVFPVDFELEDFW